MLYHRRCQKPTPPGCLLSSCHTCIFFIISTCSSYYCRRYPLEPESDDDLPQADATVEAVQRLEKASPHAASVNAIESSEIQDIVVATTVLQSEKSIHLDFGERETVSRQADVAVSTHTDTAQDVAASCADGAPLLHHGKTNSACLWRMHYTWEQPVGAAADDDAVMAEDDELITHPLAPTAAEIE